MHPSPLTPQAVAIRQLFHDFQISLIRQRVRPIGVKQKLRSTIQCKTMQLHVRIHLAQRSAALQKPLCAILQLCQVFWPHNIGVRIFVRQDPLPLTMASSRWRREQRSRAKLHEQVIQLSSVISRATGLVDLSHGVRCCERHLVGPESDHGPIFLVELVYVQSSLSAELFVFQPQ